MGRKSERSEIGLNRGKGRNRMAVKKSEKVALSISKRALGGKSPIEKKTSMNSRTRKRIMKRKMAAEQANNEEPEQDEFENDQDDFDQEGDDSEGDFEEEVDSAGDDEDEADFDDDFEDDAEEAPEPKKQTKSKKNALPKSSKKQEEPVKKMKMFEDEGDESEMDEDDDLGEDEFDLEDEEEDEEDGGSDSDESIVAKSKRILKRDREMQKEAEEKGLLDRKEDEEDSDDDDMYDQVHESNPNDIKSLKSQILVKLELLKKAESYRKYHEFMTKRGEKSKTKSDLMTEVIKQLESFYSYNSFLMEQLMHLFRPKEIIDFLEASECERPLTIRTNTLKTRRKDLAQALINRGVNLDPLGKWSKVGLVIYQATVSMGATPEYLAGQYVIQGASSMIPVMALAPKCGEKVLDMCAAPGMKSTYISQIMKNTGILVANDANPERCKAVFGNMHRCGVTNTTITSFDGRKLALHFPEYFDRVLVDAPCTGTGVISKDPSVKSSKGEHDMRTCVTMQKNLLLAAIDSCKSKSASGSFIVYSTCSVLVEENEAVVEYALKHRHVTIVPISDLDIGERGFTRFHEKTFSPGMKHCRRFYPHQHNMEGFFVCKLLKKADGIKTDFLKDNSEATVQNGHGFDYVSDQIESDKEPEPTSKKEVKFTSKKKSTEITASSKNVVEKPAKKPVSSGKVNGELKKRKKVASESSEKKDKESSSIKKKSKKLK